MLERRREVPVCGVRGEACEKILEVKDRSVLLNEAVCGVPMRAPALRLPAALREEQVAGGAVKCA